MVSAESIGCLFDRGLRVGLGSVSRDSGHRRYHPVIGGCRGGVLVFVHWTFQGREETRGRYFWGREHFGWIADKMCNVSIVKLH